MFDETLGKYTGIDYTIELQENAKQYHATSFPIALIQLSRKKLINLVKIRVLKKIDNSQFEASTFIIPEIHSAVRLISDFRELN